MTSELTSQRLATVGALAALLLSTPHVYAQETSPQSTPEESTNDASAEEAGGDTATDTDADLDEARERFRQGLTLARAGNCVGALAEFEASLAVVERPNTLFNAARCQEELFRYDLAVAYYERYLALAPADDPDRAAVEATMRSMRALLGTVVVSLRLEEDDDEGTLPDEAEVWLGDRLVGVAPGEVLIPGGRHSFELRAPGFLPARQEVEVAGRQRVEIEVTLARAEVRQVTEVTHQHTTVEVTEEGGTPPGLFYGGVGLTLAALATTSAFAVLTLASKSATENENPLDYAAIADGNDTTSTWALLTDVSLGVTAALGITTLVLYFVTDWGEDDEVDTDTQAGVELFVTPSGFGGRF